MDDFRAIAALLGIEKHWHSDDGKDTLSVERARYWLPLVTRAHIPQLVLSEQLRNNEKPNPEGFRTKVHNLLNQRAMLLLALDYAARRNTPVEWPDMKG